ncbi:MAG: zinc-ribbon domain containing protein [Acidobacteria bacterium]|nr:zinc-ribbon domain containing protein [Acidobacteriota bacterium]
MSRCLLCSASFAITAGEADWYREKGWVLPRRCARCRRIRRTGRPAEVLARPSETMTDPSTDAVAPGSPSREPAATSRSAGDRAKEPA